MSNSIMNRRQFLTSAAAISLSSQLHSSELVYGQNNTSKGGDKLKIGLYSVTFLGIWYQGEPLTLEEVIDFAQENGYDGVELGGKRPHANPLDWPERRCKSLKKYAKDKGIDIYSVAANNDFSSPMPEFREAQITFVKELIRMASDMGAKTVRIMLGWPGVTLHPRLATYSIARDIWKVTHEKFSEEEIWAWCREGMIESAKYASDYGVTLALQNHSPVIKDYKDVLKMVNEVNSPNLKVSLDVPIMKDKSPENIRRAAKEVGSLQALSHFGGEYKREPDGSIKGADIYPIFIEMMRKIGYSNFIGYELCHKLPKVNGQTVGVEYVTLSAQLACEYMKGLIDKHYV